jgi:UDP-glucuronate decarboxylase
MGAPGLKMAMRMMLGLVHAPFLAPNLARPSRPIMRAIKVHLPETTSLKGTSTPFVHLPLTIHPRPRATRMDDGGFHRRRATDPRGSNGADLFRKRVMVTGGAGFLGSHLCEILLSHGHDVLCVDNYYTGRRSNIEHLLSNPRFEAMRHDITNPLYVEVDEIYNLACPASPVHYQFDPVQTLKTSVHGSINMLGLAKRVKAKIFQASTSEVYGDPLVHPQPETYWGHVNTMGPRSCYDEGKRAAETLFFDYNRQHGVEVRVARIFNTYGPRMHPNDGRVVSNFVLQALRGEDITIYGDGAQTRSFCYVDDLLAGFIKLMDNDKGFIGPVNLGNPVEFTIKELAGEVIDLTGSRSKLVFQPLPGDDPKQRKPDITVAREMLDWEPKIALRQGLVRTIDYFDHLMREKIAV